MNFDLPNGLTEELLKAQHDAPGQTFSGSISTDQQARAFTPATSVDINSGVQGVRPRVPGNDSHDVTAGRIRKPSSNLPRRLAEGDAANKAAELAQREEEQQFKAESDPVQMLKRIAFLERSLKRTQKDLKALQQKTTND